MLIRLLDNKRYRKDKVGKEEKEGLFFIRRGWFWFYFFNFLIVKCFILNIVVMLYIRIIEN